MAEQNTPDHDNTLVFEGDHHRLHAAGALGEILVALALVVIVFGLLILPWAIGLSHMWHQIFAN